MTIRDLPLEQKNRFIYEMMDEVCHFRTNVANDVACDEVNWYHCYGMRRALEILYGDTTKTLLLPFFSDFGEMTIQQHPQIYTDEELLDHLLKAFDISLAEYENYKKTIIKKEG